MPLAFLMKKITAVLLMPPLLPLLLIIAGAMLARRRPRRGFPLIWIGVSIILFSMTPVVVNVAARWLEAAVPLGGHETMRGAQAIVVLGAGQRRFQPEYGGPVPNRLSIERLRYAARVARSSGLPILLSGGAPEGHVAESVVMAQALSLDFAVDARWIEDRSLDTADNARFSADVLLPSGVRRIVLVTHAMHMPRARAEFERAGFAVIPGPMGYLSSDDPDVGFWDFLPSIGALETAWYVAHEAIGLLAQRLRFMWQDRARDS